MDGRPMSDLSLSASFTGPRAVGAAAPGSNASPAPHLAGSEGSLGSGIDEAELDDNFVIRPTPPIRVATSDSDAEREKRDEAMHSWALSLPMQIHINNAPSRLRHYSIKPDEPTPEGMSVPSQGRSSVGLEFRVADLGRPTKRNQRSKSESDLAPPKPANALRNVFPLRGGAPHPTQPMLGLALGRFASEAPATRPLDAVSEAATKAAGKKSGRVRNAYSPTMVPEASTSRPITGRLSAGRDELFSSALDEAIVSSRSRIPALGQRGDAQGETRSAAVSPVPASPVSPKFGRRASPGLGSPATVAAGPRSVSQGKADPLKTDSLASSQRAVKIDLLKTPKRATASPTKFEVASDVCTNVEKLLAMMPAGTLASGVWKQAVDPLELAFKPRRPEVGKVSSNGTTVLFIPQSSTRPTIVLDNSNIGELLIKAYSLGCRVPSNRIDPSL